MVVGLAADGEVSLPDLDLADGPLVVVVGSEGRGLSRLVGETCDLRVSIPMTASTTSASMVMRPVSFQGGPTSDRPGWSHRVAHL